MRFLSLLALCVLAIMVTARQAYATAQQAVATAQQAAVRPHLRLITVDEPPASYKNQHGELDGYAVAVVKALQRELADQQPIELMPEGRALLTAEQDPNVLLFSFSRTPAREPLYHWLLPILQKRWQIVQRVGERAVSSLTTLCQLPAVAVVRGDVRERYLRDRHCRNLVAVGTPQQALAMLQAGRVQALALDSVALAYLLRQQKSARPAVRVSWTFHQSDVYLIMPQHASAALVARWQQAVTRLVRSGELSRLAADWQQQLQQELGIEVQRQGYQLLF